MVRMGTESSDAQGIESSEKNASERARRFSVAPMMDWTDRHCRVFHRVLTRRALLYTEMVTTGAVLHGDRASGCWRSIRPSIRWRCSWAASIRPTWRRRRGSARTCGYDEINLNVGCPSDRVQSGRFGACLMREPELVGRLHGGDGGGGRRCR